MSREFVALAIMGIDQHENGAIAVARVLREAQMKVDYFGKFHTPNSVAEKAIKDGADVIGISCHSWEYLRLVPELIQQLRTRGSDIPVVIGGSVITPEDSEKMRQLGVAAVFTSSTESDDLIECVRGLTASRKKGHSDGVSTRRRKSSVVAEGFLGQS